MDIEKLVEIVEKREPKPIGIKREYAVLIPLIDHGGRWEIIYELRSMKLNKQPGEISFPGGKVEPGETYREAAIRETEEELLISRDHIEVIGELDYIVSHENITVYCFLGIIHGLDFDDISPSEDEVDHIFTVPLDYLLETEPDHYNLGVGTMLNEKFPYNLIPNGRDYDWRMGVNNVYFYFYDEYIIWGLTAKMTKSFIDIVKEG